MSEVLNRVKNGSGFTFWCLGCDEYHQINTNPSYLWEFNGDLVKPTFSPSYLTWLDPNPNANPKYGGGKYFNGFRCHSHIKDGKIEYLGDCTHKLAGQTVDMVTRSQLKAMREKI